MVASVVIGVIVFVIALVIYLEYRNEKKYQEERQKEKEKKQKKLTPKVTTRKRAIERPTPRPSPVETKPEPKPEEETPPVQKKSTEKETPSAADIYEIKTEESVSKGKKERVVPPETSKPEPVTEKSVETAEAAKKEEEEPSPELPKGEYPRFNYERLMEMGLSDEEAHEFIQELIPQIGEQIPLLDEALKIPDFHKMERLTHSIKGSSTTIGTGGVSDLLVDYNTYLKTGEEVPVAEAYQKHLKYYFEKLKKQFPKKD